MIQIALQQLQLVVLAVQKQQQQKLGITLDAGGGIYLEAESGACRITDPSAPDAVFAPTHDADITTKQYVDRNHYHFIRAGFVSSNANKVYIPIAGAEVLRETTTLTGGSENLVFLCPYDGSLQKVMARSEEVCGNSTVGFHKAVFAVETPSTTATQSVVMDMAADDTNYTFDFASAGTNTFSAGNFLVFSFDPTSDSDDTHLIIVLKLDTST